jgi:tetratricopeptide (TPR) repeat protein
LGVHELAFDADDPPLRLAVPAALPEEERAEHHDALLRAIFDDDRRRAAWTLLQLGADLPANDGATPDSVTLVLGRCALTQLAARIMREAGEEVRAEELLRASVEELATLVDRGGSDALALWLSARFDLFWSGMLTKEPGVSLAGDLGVAMDTAVTATRDGRLDERSGFGLITTWIDVFDTPGLWDAALVLRRSLVDIARERFGALEPVTLALRHLEADLLETAGHLDKAWKRFEQLRRDIERAGETGGRLALQVRSGHAFLAGRRGMPRRAIRLYRELLADLESGRFVGDSTGTFDAHAPVAGTTYQSAIALVRMNLATWLLDEGELEDAAEVLRAVVERATETVLAPGQFLEEAADALQVAQHDLGTTLRDLGRHEECVPVFRALLAGRLSMTEPDEVQLDDARGHLMEALLRTGDHEGARAVGEVLLGSRTARLGPADPWTVLAAAQLAAAEQALGNHEALELLVGFTQELLVMVGESDERTLHGRILVQAAIASDGGGLDGADELAASNLRDCLAHLGSRHHLTADARRAARRR